MNKVKKCRYGEMVYQPNDVFIGRSLELYGEFSEEEVNLFRRLVKPGNTVLDVGANIGAHTIPLARLVGPGGQVLAFEPQRITYYCLCASVALNNLLNVHCHHAALGETRGSIRVPELKQDAEQNFGGLELKRDHGSARTYEVPLWTIDTLGLTACHFIKIDVEGMEKDVLAGATATLRSLRPILYVEDDRKDHSAPLRELLASLDYEMYLHRPPYYNPANFANNATNVFGRIVSLNLYCHPREMPSLINPADFAMEKVGPPRTVAAVEGPVLPDLLALAQRSRQAGDLVRAEQLCRQVLDAGPATPEAWSLLGTVSWQQGKLDEAIAAYRQTVRLAPDNAGSHNGLGAALAGRDQPAEAADCFRRALELQPAFAEAHSNLGNVLALLGQSDAALACYKEALRLQPDYADAHWNRALVLLQQGDLERGWPEYEWRPKGTRRGPWPYAQPLWDGSALEGRTILLYAEQGLGDTLQFVRYAPLVKQRGGTVLLLCPPALRTLLTGFPGVDRLLVQGEPLPAFDVQASLLSLPFLLKTTSSSIPAQVPYLRAEPHLVRRWRAELEPLGGYRVGIVWQGSPSHKRDRLRSVPLARFEPLAHLPGVHLVSLQKGSGSEQVRAVGFPVLDPSDRLDEQSGPFLDTAAVLANLDLLIGVDTAVVHLAGALGVPTWLVLGVAPDWRWQLGREDSPWYPSLRLFRQTRPGDWDDVFQRLAQELHRHIQMGGAVNRLVQMEENSAPDASVAVQLFSGMTEAAAELLARGQHQEQAGDWQAAEQVYRQAVQVAPENAELWYLHATACRMLGRLEEALASYQRAVALGPDQARTHNDLGTVRASRQEMQAALASFEEAVRLQPSFAEAHSNRGNVLRSLGKLDEAAASYREALRLRPDLADAWYNLGTLLSKQGQKEEALSCFRETTRLKPTFADAHNHLGNVLRGLGQRGEAAASFREAIRLRPDFARAWFNLGTVLQELGQQEEAHGPFQEALRLRPDFVEAHNNLGNVLQELGQLEKAVTQFREALRLRPDFVEAHNNLGNVLRDLGQLDEAAASYREALRLRPDFAAAHTNLGNALGGLGGFDAALGCYEEALRLQPNQPEAHLNRALIRLLRGDLERGWPEYEWRSRGAYRNPRLFGQPWWDGKALEGRTILLHAEQGLGDTLQFVRYAPLVKQRGGTVLLLCPPALRALLTGFPGVDRLLVQGEPLPAFDVQAPLLSLPRLLGTTAASIPAAVPYLRADPHLVQRWRSELEPLTGCRVGIVWQGNPRHKEDRLRSVPLACFEPLARVPGVRLVSLQKGPGSEQVRTAGFAVLDLSRRLDEQSGPFLDTAAVLVNLDLVVGVDTVVVHLAGALGVPTWLALALAPDWRWQLGREDSPWYPSLRLFRQTQPGHWDDVFQRLAAALRQRLV